MKKIFTIVTLLIALSLQAQRSALISEINSKIYQNSTHQITGTILNGVMLDMVNQSFIHGSDSVLVWNDTLTKLASKYQYLPYSNARTYVDLNSQNLQNVSVLYTNNGEVLNNLYVGLGIGGGYTNRANGVLYFFNSTNTYRVALSAPSTASTYTLNLPTSQGSSGQTIQNDGSGNLSWVTPSSAIGDSGIASGYGTRVTAASPRVIRSDTTVITSKNYLTSKLYPYQKSITLTTTGSSGAATLIGTTLNIPQYTLSGLGGISLTSLSASSPLSYNNSTGAFSINQSNTSTNGYLSSTDWNTFNGKQSAYTNLSSIGSLSNTAGYLYNNGSGSFSYTTPTGYSIGYANLTVSAGAVAFNANSYNYQQDSLTSSATTYTVSFSGFNAGTTCLVDYFKTTASNCAITFPANCLISVASGMAVSGSYPSAQTVTVVSTTSGEFTIQAVRVDPNSSKARYHVYITQDQP